MGDCFALPSGLRCVRCDHPLTYGTESLACERCDTVFNLLERYPPLESCPNCGGPAAWMGGVLVCSPVPHPSWCSQGFVPAPPTPARFCARCCRELPSSNRANLCFPCALRAYLDLRPGAAKIHTRDDPTNDEWREIVGFAETDSLWATAGPVGGHPGYDSEFYAVGVGSATLRAGQLLCALPPWSSHGGATGTVWLVRIGCPSGVIYEVAFPAGWLSDETAAVDERRRRATPLPERILNSTGVASGTVERELRAARTIVNALSRTPGGRPPDPVDDILTTIRKIQANGDTPSKTRVAQEIYGHAANPRDSLDQRLGRLKARSGITWRDLQARASSEF